MMPTRKSKEKIYFKDSQYKRMISAYQKGEWGIAGKLLSKLLKDYPGEEELKSLSVDIKIRKQLDSDAKKEAEGIRKKRIRRIIYSVVAIAIVVTVSVIAYDNYSVRVQQEFEAISLQRNLTASFEEAQNFLKAGRAAEAKELLDEISELEEDYPQLSESYEQVLFLLELESQYEKASNQSQEGDFSGSLET
jgi:predicted Zn-dependent protease